MEPDTDSTTEKSTRDSPTEGGDAMENLFDHERGDRIGSYILLELIGVGGMGEVWKAQQHSPVERVVALKIVRAGMNTREHVQRFEAERQALALMQHPNIAQVYDGGTTAYGVPYFVMELVTGEPIDRYCQQTNADIRRRLRLFLQVCHAIQHAHHKGIVHRDLKPSNVLVFDDGHEARAKVIDFGIAKALGPKLGNRTLPTLNMQRWLTREYASPEQLEYGAKRVDTRSDLYSLGALLYELLTGERVFHGAAEHELHRLIVEEDPVKPSSRIRKRQNLSKANEGKRKEYPAVRWQDVRGDLDAILMKSLRKEPSARYQHASEFAADLENYLSQRPVTARRATTSYIVRKLLRRHSVTIRNLAAVILLFLVASSAALYLSNSRRAEEAAGHLYKRLFECHVEALPSVVASIHHAGPMERQVLEPMLTNVANDPDESANARMRAIMAVAPDNPYWSRFLETWLMEARPSEIAIALAILDQQHEDIARYARQVIRQNDCPVEHKLRAAGILATLAPNAAEWEMLGKETTRWLTDQKTFQALKWLPLLEPASQHLVDHLTSVFHQGRDTEKGEVAAIALQLYQNDPSKLVELVSRADVRQMPIIVESLHEHREAGVQQLRAFLRREAPTDPGHPDYLERVRERQRVMIALFLLEEVGSEEWTALESPPDPTLRSYLINGLSEYAVSPRALAAELEQDHSASLLTSFLLALGHYSPAQLTALDRDSLHETIEDLYKNHASPGVHSAAEWVLRSWGHDLATLHRQIEVRQIPKASAVLWYHAPNGHTMAIIEQDGRRFAIATKETTVEQFAESGIDMSKLRSHISPKPNCPVNAIPAYDAMRYCNWLSERAGLPESEWCYEEGPNGNTLAIRNLSELTGFRLPSSEEWIIANLAGSEASTSFGNAPSLARYYAWLSENSSGIAQPVGTLMPNHFGLFDCLGNLRETCHETLSGPNRQVCVLHGGWAGTGAEGLWPSYISAHQFAGSPIVLDLDYYPASFRVVQNRKEQ